MSINEEMNESCIADYLHAWCRWRTFINNFLIDRLRIGRKIRRDPHATPYFQILNGIEIPPTLTGEDCQDVWFKDRHFSDDPKTLDWHLKHNIPRAKYRRSRSSSPFSNFSINSLSNSEVSFESSGLTSGWTSWSSIDSDNDLNQTKTRRRRKRRTNPTSDKSLLTWSRLKLKLTQKRRRSSNIESFESSNSVSSCNISPISSDYSERSTDRQNDDSSSHYNDRNCSVNSRKFPFVSRIFLPDRPNDDQQKLQKSLTRDKNKFMMKDGQGRVFIDVGHALRHGHPLDDVDQSNQVRALPSKYGGPIVKFRPRLRMYGAKIDDTAQAEREYFNFMFDRFKQLYHEDAAVLTNLSQHNINNRSSRQQERNRVIPKNKKNGSRRRIPSSDYYLQHYGKF